MKVDSVVQWYSAVDADPRETILNNLETMPFDVGQVTLLKIVHRQVAPFINYTANEVNLDYRSQDSVPTG